MTLLDALLTILTLFYLFLQIIVLGCIIIGTVVYLILEEYKYQRIKRSINRKVDK